MKILLAKLKESAVSVLPIAVIVLILCFVLGGVSKSNIIGFAVGAVMLIMGMTLFTLGADIAMVKIGQFIGSSLTKTKKLPIILSLSLLLGVIVTIAEPDLIVLSEQLSAAINSYALIATVGIGVGLFLTLAMLRIIFQIPLRTLFIILYGIVFVLAFFVPDEFLAVAFDSGGVTTGPMTVPFIMAFGIGVASTKEGDNQEDNFGLIALCSIGPILAVMILGLFVDTSKLVTTDFSATVGLQEGKIAMTFLSSMPDYLKEVAIALSPIFVFFLIYNAVKLKLPKKVITRILFGMLFVYVGLVVFLAGVNVGFSPLAKQLGAAYVDSGKMWFLIPTGVLLGFFIVAAEPAVHVLNEQVEEISGGTIKKGAMLLSLMVGVGIALGLSMLRVVTGIHILYILIPGYVLALLLSFFVPKVYTAIAFDSGGVASGPLTATFLLPFAIGACAARGENIMTDAYGVVAFVAMAPLLTIQLLGLFATLKVKRVAKKLELKEIDADLGLEHSVVFAPEAADDDEIVVFEDEARDTVENIPDATQSSVANVDLEEENKEELVDSQDKASE